MSQAWERAFEAHKDEALALKEAELLKPNFDLPTYIREANQTLQLARECWAQAPEEGAPPLEVFANFYGPERLERAQRLVYALQHAVGVRLFEAEGPSKALKPRVQRAQKITRELSGALGFVLEGGVDEVAEAQLRALRRATAAGGASASAVGSILGSWVSLAGTQRARLAALGDFDFGLLDEGEALCGELSGARRARSEDTPPWARLRAGLYTLVQREIQALRRVVERAYRNHEATLGRFASAERRRRLEQRRGEGVSN